MFYASTQDINAAIPLDVIYITSGIIYKIEMGQCQMKNIILWRKVSININNQKAINICFANTGHNQNYAIDVTYILVSFITSW